MCWTDIDKLLSAAENPAAAAAQQQQQQCSFQVVETLSSAEQTLEWVQSLSDDNGSPSFEDDTLNHILDGILDVEQDNPAEETASSKRLQQSSSRPINTSDLTLELGSTDVSMDYSDNGSLSQSLPREVTLDKRDSLQSSSDNGQSGGKLSPTQDIKEEDDGSLKMHCLVCGDVANGLHYGISSCEACKAFFKRSVQGNIQYTCHMMNNCSITTRRRKACQACRYQKCIRMGMIKEGVRLDRVRGGRQKYKKGYEDCHSVSSPRRPSLTDNKVLQALLQCEPELLASMEDDESDSSSSVKQAVASDLSQFLDAELETLIHWVAKIPGFSLLSQIEQAKLLHSSWLEVLTLVVVHRTILSLKEPYQKLCFAPDVLLDEQTAKHCGLLDYFNQCMMIVNNYARLDIHKEEFVLIKAILLSNGEISTMDQDSAQSLSQLRDNLLASLSDCVAVTRPGTSIVDIQKLLLLLPSVRQADAQMKAYLARLNHHDNQDKLGVNIILAKLLTAEFAMD